MNNISKGEYTYVELSRPQSECLPSIERWLKRNLGYSGLSTWYITYNLPKPLTNKLGFKPYADAIVFYSSEDAIYFKLKCPPVRNDGVFYDPDFMTEDYYFT